MTQPQKIYELCWHWPCIFMASNTVNWAAIAHHVFFKIFSDFLLDNILPLVFFDWFIQKSISYILRFTPHMGGWVVLKGPYYVRFYCKECWCVERPWKNFDIIVDIISEVCSKNDFCVQDSVNRGDKWHIL